MNQLLTSFKNIHCIGIGGSGVSALARLLKAGYGLNVNGSDQKESSLTEQLKKEGFTVHIGHKKENLSSSVEAVIYSPSIPPDNAERMAAKQRKIPQLSYPEAVGLLTREKQTISICGTHGKTTTTGLLATAFIQAGADPTVIIGSPLKELKKSNYRAGMSPYFILESCEYRRGFLNYFPKIIVITNVEPDHLDYYKDGKDYKKAFAEFIDRLSPNGTVIANYDDKSVQEICQKSNKKVISFGKKQNYDYHLKANDIFKQQTKIATLNLQIAGEHNQLNALAGLAVCSELKLDLTKTLRAMNEYQGAERRFEIKGTVGKTTIIDDYAHHPTEVKTTLKALREKYGSDKKVACIFQPHQYNRTHNLLQDFATAFEAADEVIISNIFTVRDHKKDLQNIDEEKLVAEISKHHNNARWGRGLDKTTKDIRARLQTYDIVITMGAGDIWQVAKNLLDS